MPPSTIKASEEQRGGLLERSRELEALSDALAAVGRPNAEVAERLFLSPKTVDHHVSAILRKLGARTRAEAGAEAVRRGFLSKDR